jgi:hypothetical protein
MATSKPRVVGWLATSSARPVELEVKTIALKVKLLRKLELCSLEFIEGRGHDEQAIKPTIPIKLAQLVKLGLRGSIHSSRDTTQLHRSLANSASQPRNHLLALV